MVNIMMKLHFIVERPFSNEAVGGYADLHGVAHDLQAIPITKWVIKKGFEFKQSVCSCSKHLPIACNFHEMFLES